MTERATSSETKKQGPRGSIRGKIILPFLILTVAVAALGTFIVTRLIANNLDERLVNQLLEAGRVASDSVVRRENAHLEALRPMVGTVGIPEAIAERDAATLRDLLIFHATNNNLDSVIVLDGAGQLVMDMTAVRATNIDVIDEYEVTTGDDSFAGVPIVANVLGGFPDEGGDKFAGLVETPEGTMLYTTAGVYVEDPTTGETELRGVVLAGTLLDRLIVQMKAEALADVALLTEADMVIGASLPEWEEPAQYNELVVDEVLFKEGLTTPEDTPVRSLTLFDREYRAAYGPLVIRGQGVGVLAVMLPTSFVAQTISTSQFTFVGVFTAAALLVVVLGLVIAQAIVRPVRRLVKASRTIARGEFSNRVEVTTRDEIGVLSDTFNYMTDRLEDYTTRLKQANDQLAADKARIEAILNSSADGIVVRDVHGAIMLTNPAALRMLRTDSGLDLDVINQLRIAETNNQRITVGERTISVNGAKATTEDGVDIGEVLLLRDVTREAIAERTKDNFLNQIGHELRTPLTAVKGFADALRVGGDRMKPETRERAINQIYEQSTVLASIIDQLIEMTSMQSGPEGLNRKATNLRDLAEEALAKWQNELTSAGIVAEVNAVEDVIADVDSRRMQRALDALIHNAIQYSPGGGRLEVDIHHDNGAAYMSLRDEGVGISEEDMPRIFDRFYRGQPIDEHGDLVDVRGMGQGLFAVKSIVEAHRGQVRVVSTPQQGATFTIELPIKDES